jgi:hypothetical protein
MKIIKGTFFIIIFLIIAGKLFTDDNKQTDNKATDQIDRYSEATEDQKNCIRTLGNGVYKDRSLEWKLDSCNVR